VSLLRKLFAPRGLIAATGIAAAGLVGGGLIPGPYPESGCLPAVRSAAHALPAARAGSDRRLAAGRPISRQHAAARVAAFVMAATAATGAWVAAYQTWLQRFAKGASCTADQPWWEHFVNWAGTQWPLMFEASGLCSEAGWKFLGLSIAEWSLIAFTSMTMAMLAVMTGKANHR
jgi:hypothetical protein